MSDISDRVKKIVVEHLGVDEDKVAENVTRLLDSGLELNIAQATAELSDGLPECSA